MYYAKGKHDKEYAIKIFKTSILVFKDRDKYVSGEYRFRNGYCKSNPRKMVKTWAEKEMRNLKRLYAHNIASPLPYLLKSHILIMDFIGSNGWCAPRLKDASLTSEQLRECYERICVDMRRMFHDCNLVHGDLSEYNLLYHNGQAMIIDVSQSVEQSHPFASDFLRKDVSNVTDFFAKKGVTVLSKMNLFQFIVDKDPVNPCINDYYENPHDMLQLPSYQNYLKAMSDKLHTALLRQDSEQVSASEEVDEAVFLKSFIPTRLSEIANPYKESELLTKGARESVYAKAVLDMIGGRPDDIDEEEEEGDNDENDVSDDEEDEDDDKELQALIAKLTKPNNNTTTDLTKTPDSTVSGQDKTSDAVGEVKSEDKDDDSESEEEGSDDDDEEEEGDGDDREEGEGKYRRKLPSRDNPEQRQKEKEARKEAKKLAKEAKAAKRLNKIPKHVKKRAMKGAGKK